MGIKELLVDQVFKISADRETLEDYHETLVHVMEKIEPSLIELDRSDIPLQDVLDYTDEFARQIDTLKNRAFAADLEPIFEILSFIENIMDKLASLGIDFSGRIPEAVLMILDRVVFMSEDAYKYSFVRMDSFNAVQHALHPLLKIKKGEEGRAAEKTIENLTGGSAQLNEEIETFAQDKEVKEAVAGLSTSSTITVEADSKQKNAKLDEDIDFFKSLAEEVDLIHKHWKGRSAFIMPIALGMNAIARNCVDFYQLQAAVYLHDVGMRFLPDELLDENGRFTKEQRELLRSHPGWVIENIDLMEGWNEAAWIVYQHHEKMDGFGYPEGTAGGEICDGAKIMAICDAFYSVMARTKNRSIYRAISEINACQGHHFCPKWVAIFNLVVRIQQRVDKN